MDKDTEDERSVSRLELLFLIRAHNRKEISYEQWLERSRAWAEAVIRQHDQAEPPPAAPD